MPLTFDQISQLVGQNNKASSLSNQCVIAVCWKESSFDPAAQSGSSTAKGLMQMTNPAVDTVNRITPVGVHFDYNDMLVAASAIQCGTYYLQWCYDQTQPPSEAAALDKYAGVTGYSTDIITAEGCLQSSVVVDPVAACLKPIHSFLTQQEQLMERKDGIWTLMFTSPSVTRGSR